MPNSSLHISFAKDAAEALDHPSINKHLGSYLLGSTSPDVRNVAGWERYDTHFFHLNTDPLGKGIERFFRHYPELGETTNLNEETKTFVVGYISHLVTDETWIVDVYRRYFGKSSTIAKDPMRNVMDRALQFHMDREERSRLGSIDEVLYLLKDSDKSVAVGFISPELLGRWKQVIFDRTSDELPWKHFRRYAKKALPDHLKKDPDHVDSLVDSGAELLSRAQAHVPDRILVEFKQKSIDQFVKLAGEYLD